MFYDCPKLVKACDNLLINGVLVRNLCPNTCQTCPQGGKEKNFKHILFYKFHFL